MSADDEDRLDFDDPSDEPPRAQGGSEEALRRMNSRRRGARSVGREQAIPILFVVVAVLLLLWWLIGLRPSGPAQVVVPTSTAALAGIATPAITLTLSTPAPGTALTTTTGITSPAGAGGPTGPAPFSTGMQVTVTGTGAEGLSLRGGPGVNNARLATLSDGAALMVVGGPEEADCGQPQLCRWWRVQASDGTVGWVIEDKITATSP